MKSSGTNLAIAGVLAATLSIPVFASPRHSTGRAAYSGGHAGGQVTRHNTGGQHPGVHGGARHYGGSTRHSAPRATIYLGVPLAAAAAYYGPRYYYPPVYVARGPQIFYYCAAYNDYYPRVQVCPSGWQQVIQPPGAHPPTYLSPRTTDSYKIGSCKLTRGGFRDARP